jgi:hypothetical protein
MRALFLFILAAGLASAIAEAEERAFDATLRRAIWGEARIPHEESPTVVADLGIRDMLTLETPVCEILYREHTSNGKNS